MSQDHQPQTDQGAAVPQDVEDMSEFVESSAPTDPMQVLIQASQAAEALQSRFAELQQLQADINVRNRSHRIGLNIGSYGQNLMKKPGESNSSRKVSKKITSV